MAGDIQRPCILIVDDRPENLYAMEHVLAEMNADLFTASSGNQALAMTIHQKFALILLDVQMPEMDGYEVATLLRDREATATVPIIFVTAVNKDRTHVFSGYEAGAVDYLFKPVDPHILKAKVRVFLELQRTADRLEKANEMLFHKNARLKNLYETADQFVDHVSHEFRTPLTVIREYSTIICDGLVGPVTEQQKEFLNTISDRTDDLANMVDDMLDVSKLEAGLLSVCRRESMLTDVLDRVRPALEQKGKAKGVALEFELNEGLPSIYCDAEKIGRVLINLAINAIKFCGEGGRVRIWARHVPEHAEVIVGVTDNGPGISAENLQLIFERFEQGEGTAKSSTKGFGLGLNIAKELVDLNLGSMSVESELNNGSTFSFTIPVWHPYHVAARHLSRIKTDDQEFTPMVTLLVVTTTSTVEAADSDALDEFLQYVFRSNDAVLRVLPRKWVVLVNGGLTEVDTLVDRVQAAWADDNRNRPVSQRMAEIELDQIGTWDPTTNSDEILNHFREETGTHEDECLIATLSDVDENLESSAEVDETPAIPTVLAVDDDTELLHGMTVRLKAGGYRVLTAVNGRLALESAIENRPDAILMDNYMPEMNGLEALIKMAANPETSGIPVIMVSASLRDHDVALEEGARYFFQKPCPPQTILSALEEVINQPATV